MCICGYALRMLSVQVNVSLNGRSYVHTRAALVPHCGRTLLCWHVDVAQLSNDQAAVNIKIGLFPSPSARRVRFR